jgi:hypothetical protein
MELASSCLSVRPSPWKNSASSGRIFKKFGIWVFFFFENMSRKFKRGSTVSCQSPCLRATREEGRLHADSRPCGSTHCLPCILCHWQTSRRRLCRPCERGLTGDGRTRRLCVSFQKGDSLHGDYKHIHANCHK